MQNETPKLHRSGDWTEGRGKMRLGGLGGVASAQQVRPVMPGPGACSLPGACRKHCGVFRSEWTVRFVSGGIKEEAVAVGGPGKQLPRRFSKKKEGPGALGPGDWTSGDVEGIGQGSSDTGGRGWQVTFPLHEKVSIQLRASPRMPDPAQLLRTRSQSLSKAGGEQRPGFHDQQQEKRCLRCPVIYKCCY